MSKVTSKLQVTIPKRLAEEYGIAAGDEIDFVAAGEVIHLVPAGRRLQSRLSPEERLRLFDAATARQREREKTMKLPATPPAGRDWRREELYTRGKPR
jgi:AbrB family looped-hinge helix DNA binding protein